MIASAEGNIPPSAGLFHPNRIAKSNKRKIKRNNTKNILAIPALAAATPVKPKMPAMIDIMKNTSAQ
jgi:hypothetical protein